MYTLYPHQEEAVQFLHDVNGTALVADDQGLGKDQPVSEPALTPDGWKPIGSLQVGDYVIGSNGKPTKVLGVYPQGIKPIYKVETQTGQYTRCTNTHLWTISNRATRKGDRVWRTCTTADVAKQLVSGCDSYRSVLLPALSPVEFSVASTLEIGPYTMGCLIANGSLHKGCIVITSHNEDSPHVLSRLQAEGVSITKSRQKIGCVATGLTSQPYRRIIDSLGLNVLSGGKFIPEEYKRASVADRKALLQGLMDCDGSISKTGNKVTYHTTSRRLAHDVSELVLSIGGSAGIREYNREAHGKPTEFQVCIRLLDWENPFSVPRKASRFSPTKCRKAVFRRIASVEPTGEFEECVCIKVDAPDSLYVTRGYILTHNTGSILSYLHTDKVWPAIVVCPTSVKHNWRIEAEMWAPGIKVQVLEGETPNEIEPDTQLVVVNYPILHHQAPAIGSWFYEIFICDESQNLSNRAAKVTKAAISLSRRAKQCICMSGTPIGNRPEDFYPTLHMIKPAMFPSFTAYGARYCAPRRTPWGVDYSGASNLDELHQRIKPFTIRRKKEILGLPERTTTVVPLEIDNREEYDKAETDLKNWVKESRFAKGKIKKELKAAALTKVSVTLGLSARLKARATVEWILNYRKTHPEKKIIIFCTHIAFADVLMRRIDPQRSVLINGSVNAKKRQEAIERFQKDPECQVIVCNIVSGNSGITLTAATTTIWCELPWNPTKVSQGQDRNHRIGQDKEVEIYFLVAKGTIEERLCEAIQKKQAIQDQVIDGQVTKSLPIWDMLKETYAD